MSYNANSCVTGTKTVSDSDTSIKHSQSASSQKSYTPSHGNIENGSISFGGTECINPYCGTMASSEQVLEEKTNMSLVGMMFNKHGIVAFGDSKSTRDNGSGNVEENGRVTQKIFKTGRFVLATFGNNEVLSDVRGKIRLEDIINSIIKSERDIDGAEFMNILHHELRRCPPGNTQAQYNFFLGEKYCDKRYGDYYFVEEYSISRESKVLVKTMRNEDIVINYTPMNPTKLFISPNWTLEQMQDSAKILVDCVTRLGDAFMEYNPVGGEIKTETLV